MSNSRRGTVSLQEPVRQFPPYVPSLTNKRVRSMSETEDLGPLPLIHETAVIDTTAIIAAQVRVGPYCHIGARSVIGADSVLAAHVVVECDATIGEGARISAGVYLSRGLALGTGVTVGANAVFVDGLDDGLDDESLGDGGSVVVGDGASIGANSSVLGGVSIGQNASVAAGSVVVRDVPAHASVVGSPATIVGYGSSPSVSASRRFRASDLEDDQFPVSIGRATLARYPRIDDLRGSITFAEVSKELPFTPLRYFLVYGVPSREVRGEHAHRELHQLLVSVHGECAVAVDDGTERGEVVLDRPDVALHLPPMVWATQFKHSDDAALLVLASNGYEESDYIRSFAEFEREVARA